MIHRDAELIAAIQDGIPLTAHPYARIAENLGWGVTEVIERLHALIDNGAIKRFGVVVRHRELGYRANAMVVWDVSDDNVNDIGARMAAIDCVTLCYRRARRLPDWPYNLYCMIHGRDRASVIDCVDRIASELSLQNTPRSVLFSKRRFKQRGARYVFPSNVPPRVANATG